MILMIMIMIITIIIIIIIIIIITIIININTMNWMLRIQFSDTPNIHMYCQIVWRYQPYVKSWN